MVHRYHQHTLQKEAITVHEIRPQKTDSGPLMFVSKLQKIVWDNNDEPIPSEMGCGIEM